MATASVVLQDHLLCPICYETFKDPYELSCRHTFCKDCISKIQKNLTIECPECRDVSSKNDLKKDFKTQRLIDAFNRQKQQREKRRAMSFSAENQDTSCEVCKKANTSIKYRCEDCDQYMCADCEISHGGMKVTQNHVVKEIKQVIKSLQSNLKTKANDLQKDENDIEIKIAEVSNIIQDVEKQNKAKMAEVDEQIDSLIEKANIHRSQLKEDIKLVNAENIENLTASKDILNQSKEKVRAKIDFLTAVATSEDITTLKKVIVEVNENLDQEIDEYKAKHPAIDPHFKSIVVNKATSWNPMTSVWISIMKQVKPVVPVRVKTDGLFADILKLRFNMGNELAICPIPEGIYVVGDVIWCGNEKGITVLTRECNQLMQIEHKNLANISCIAECHTGNIIVGCHDRNGLHMLDKQGVYIIKIASGSFSSVCCNKGTMYALESGTSSLYIYKYTRNQWISNGKTTLDYISGSKANKLAIYNDQIYISLYNLSKIYILGKDLTLLNILEVKLSKEINNGKGLIMCGIDEFGNILAVDCVFNNIMVYKKKVSAWESLPLPNKVQGPMNVGVDPLTKDVWITTLNMKIIKCSAQ